MILSTTWTYFVMSEVADPSEDLLNGYYFQWNTGSTVVVVC